MLICRHSQSQSKLATTEQQPSSLTSRLLSTICTPKNTLLTNELTEEKQCSKWCRTLLCHLHAPGCGPSRPWSFQSTTSSTTLSFSPFFAALSIPSLPHSSLFISRSVVLFSLLSHCSCLRAPSCHANVPREITAQKAVGRWCAWSCFQGGIQLLGEKESLI